MMYNGLCLLSGSSHPELSRSIARMLETGKRGKGKEKS